MPVLLLIGGVLLYSYINQGKAAINQIQYTPKRLKFVNVGIFSFTVDLYFNIENNTNAAASIQQIDGLLKSGTVQIGTFKTKQPFTIAANATTEVASRVNISNIEALKIIYKAFINRKTPAIDFDGAIQTTLLGRIPFNYPAVLAEDLTIKKRKW